MTEAKVKGLTQAQKNYLVKRINEIANAKIGKLGGTPNYGVSRHSYYTGCSIGPTVNKHNLGPDVLLAIVDGTVKLRSKTDLMAEIKSVAIASKSKTYTNLGILAFIDLKSLEKFNTNMNKKKKDDYEAKQKRWGSVREEADKLKDSVMLEGSLATEVLDNFEKKEF